MATVLLRTGLVAIALCAGAGWAAGQSSRQAEDRRVDENSRQTQSVRQTEPPKPAEAKASVQRQPEPQRQSEPQRQPEPQRQREPQRHAESSGRDDATHSQDPGSAWRSQGPAWRDLNDRPNVPRPGQDAFRAKPDTYGPRDRDRGGRRDRDSRGGGIRRETTVYVPYPYPVYDVLPYYPSQIETQLVPSPEPVPAPAADDRPLGFLQLRVRPRTAEVFVDGAFAGTVDDFGGRGARMVPAGPRRVEIMAPGYETLTFDVRVPENDTVTFTRDLEPASDRPAPDPIVVPHKTMYLVPKCFIGDRPPQLSDMPAGCRVEDVRVIP